MFPLSKNTFTQMLFYSHLQELYHPSMLISHTPHYGVTFVGTYGDYMQEVFLIHQLERPKRFLANKFLLKMRQHPHMTSENALHEVLSEPGT